MKVKLIKASTLEELGIEEENFLSSGEIDVVGKKYSQVGDDFSLSISYRGKQGGGNG